ncbi:MAG: phage portal protein [Pseudomonadota bacterium]|nr:phage portal protein [Pseudomonadota bacterium]
MSWYNPFSWGGFGFFQNSELPDTVYELSSGGSNSSTSVTPATAMQSPVIWSAVTLISGTMSTLPFKLYTDSGETREEVKKTFIMDRPNKLMSMSSFIESAMIWGILEGNFYAVITRNSQGQVIALTPVDGQTVTPLIEDGDLIYKVKLQDGKTTLVSPEYMIHFKFFSQDGYVGLRFVDYLSQTIGNANKARDYSSAFLDNGGFSGGLVIFDKILTEEQRAQVKKRFQNIKQEGVKDISKLVVLEGDPKFVPRSTSNKDAQLLDSREFDDFSIAGALKIPPHMVGLVSKTTSWGTGIEQQNIAFVTYCLRYYANKIEDEMNHKLFKGEDYKCEFVFNGLLRGDSASRADYYKAALGGSGGSGWMTTNEVRKLENMAPIEGGNTITQWEQNANEQSTATD